MDVYSRLAVKPRGKAAIASHLATEMVECYMLVAFTFRAKVGKEEELERLLDNPESGLRIAKALGAIRNALFLGNGRIVRIFEFPEGVKPMTMTDLARKDPKVKEFLRSLSTVIEDGFDVGNLETLDDFSRRSSLRLAYDVRSEFAEKSSN